MSRLPLAQPDLVEKGQSFTSVFYKPAPSPLHRIAIGCGTCRDDDRLQGLRLDVDKCVLVCLRTFILGSSDQQAGKAVIQSVSS